MKEGAGLELGNVGIGERKELEYLGGVPRTWSSVSPGLGLDLAPGSVQSLDPGVELPPFAQLLKPSPGGIQLIGLVGVGRSPFGPNNHA